MSNSLSVKLGLEASGFNKGMKEASESTRQYTNEVTKITKDLPNLKRELVQSTKETMGLTLAISRLTKEQRNSAEGRKMIQMLEESKKKTAELKDMALDTQAAVKNMASDTRGLDVMKDAVGVAGNAFSALAGTIGLVTGEEDKLKKAMVAFTTVQSTVNGLTAIQNALQEQSSLMLGITTAQQKLRNASIKLETAAQSQNIVVTKGATAAQWALNAAAEANPYVLLISALVAVGVALVAFANYTDEAAKKEQKQKEETEKLKQSVEEFAQTAGNEYGKLRSSYEQLRKEWNDLSSEHEKSEWLKTHKNAVDDLTDSVHDVISADKFFNDETGNVIKSFKLRAQAAAAAALATKYYQKSLEASLQKNSAANVNGTFISVDTYNKLPEAVKKKAKANYTTKFEGVQYNTPTLGGTGGINAKEVLTGYTLEGLTDAEVLKYGLVNQKFAKEEKEYEKIADTWIEKQAEFEKEVVHNPAGGTTKPTKPTKNGTNNGLTDEEKKALKERENEILKSTVDISIDYTPNEIKDKIKDLQTQLDNTPIKINGEFNPEVSKIKKEIESWQDKLNPSKSIVDPKEFEKSLDGVIEYNNRVLQQMEDDDKRAKEQKLENLNEIGQGIQTIGGMMASISQLTDDESVNIMAIVGQAVANVALGFSKALAQNGKLGVWDWIAAAAAGLATMVSVQNTIKSQTSGYADGGVITGPYSSGDRMIARVNAGEMILNKRQQSNLFNAIDENRLGGSSNNTITLQSVKVRGADLYLTMKNYENTTGKKL